MNIIMRNKYIKSIGMTLICTVGVSAIYFIIALLDLFTINNVTYFIIYLTGFLLFLGIRTPILKRECNKSENIYEYLVPNYAVLIFLIISSLICDKFASSETFTLFFSFTKVFKQLDFFPFNLDSYISTLTVWIIYGFEVALIAYLYGDQTKEPVESQISINDHIDIHDDAHWARIAAEMAAEQLGELPDVLVDVLVDDNSDARRAARIAAEMLGSFTDN